jgi:hypothetical protein
MDSLHYRHICFFVKGRGTLGWKIGKKPQEKAKFSPPPPPKEGQTRRIVDRQTVPKGINHEKHEKTRKEEDTKHKKVGWNMEYTVCGILFLLACPSSAFVSFVYCVVSFFSPLAPLAEEAGGFGKILSAPS